MLTNRGLDTNIPFASLVIQYMLTNPCLDTSIPFASLVIQYMLTNPCLDTNITFASFDIKSALIARSGAPRWAHKLKTVPAKLGDGPADSSRAGMGMGMKMDMEMEMGMGMGMETGMWMGMGGGQSLPLAVASVAAAAPRTPPEQEVVDVLTPNTWSRTWELHKCRARLGQLDRSDALQALSRQRVVLQSRLRRLVGELVVLHVESQIYIY